MAVIWTNNAYQTGDLSLWSGEQEVASDRIQSVSPPAEVGGGPQSRSFLGKFRIEPGDGNPAGASGQRAEVLRTGVWGGTACQGGEIWIAWESYFGDPNVVSDTNAFRPNGGSSWNSFTQWHQGGGLSTQPWACVVDATSSPWKFRNWTRGGPETNPTGLLQHDLGTFTYGWHEFRCYIKFGQSDGRSKIWIDGTVRTDYTGPVGYNPDGAGGTCNYLKQGYYKNTGSQRLTIFHTGTRAGTTEADVLAGGGTTPPPTPPPTPAANTRERRFGKATVGGGRNGFTQNMSSGSKFQTSLASNETGMVKDMHIYVEGQDGSASTQKLTLGIYDDDGSGGAPGTKFGESDVEIEVAGDEAGAWEKVTLGTPIAILGTSVWVVAGADTPTNRLAYATDTLASGLVFGNDTYGSAPHLDAVYSVLGFDNIEMSICADYDVSGDVTAPVLQSAVCDGQVITLAYNEALDTASVPQVGDFSVLVGGVASVALSAVTISGSNCLVTLTATVSSTESIVASYTRATGREIQDFAGNAASNFSSFAVVNEAPDETQPARVQTFARVTTFNRSDVPGAHVGGLGGGGV